MKTTLNDYYDKYHQANFIENDPILFPRRYTKLQDIEVVALLTSTIAWGKRAMILRSCESLFQEMGPSPYEYIQDGMYKTFDPSKNIHRTFFGRDFIYICNGLNMLYTKHNSMEELFVDTDTWSGIENLRNLFVEANNGLSSRHISNPNKSACKRFHMMLRWLCRKNSPVDLGIWKNIDAKILQIPLDVHVARTAKLLGICKRNANDRKTVEEITSTLSRLCPEDPIKYDFALFGYGVNN